MKGAGLDTASTRTQRNGTRSGESNKNNLKANFYLIHSLKEKLPL